MAAANDALLSLQIPYVRAQNKAVRESTIAAIMSLRFAIVAHVWGDLYYSAAKQLNMCCETGGISSRGNGGGWGAWLHSRASEAFQLPKYLQHYSRSRSPFIFFCSFLKRLMHQWSLPNCSNPSLAVPYSSVAAV